MVLPHIAFNLFETQQINFRLLSVNEASLNAIPTVAKMRALHNNYEKDTAVNEYVTAMERNEENDFIDSLLSSSIMRLAMQFLQQKGLPARVSCRVQKLIRVIPRESYPRPEKPQRSVENNMVQHVFSWSR